jgi:CRISPR-associated protein Csd2
VETVKADEPGYEIYIKDNVPLNTSDRRAFDYLGINEKTVKDKKKEDPAIDRKIRDFMCKNFFDIRTFGAVMTTFVKAALNCGQVRGPVQLGFARSIDPVVQQEVAITRIAITTEADAEKKGTEMGRKYVIPYAMYRMEGYISANLAQKSTGFSEDDLNLLWDAIINMFEHDHSAARGKMAVRELVVFKHESILGNAPSYKLFETVRAQRKDSSAPARKYSDYTVSVDTDTIPAGVTCIRMI